MAGDITRISNGKDKKKKKAPEGLIRATGDILEEIVAEMHRELLDLNTIPLEEIEETI